jgi:ABC-2 type transport system permease protein
LIGLLLVLIVAAFGAIFYGVEVPWERLPLLVLTLALAAATFCALGLAVSSLIPNADAAPAVVNATILPLLFISNVFIRLEDPPAWMDTLAGIFPVRHFADAMLATYAPGLPGVSFSWADLVVIAAWGLAAALFSLRFFSWEPRS